MATWKGYIQSMNGYRGQYIEVDAVRTASAARQRMEALYPGAKITGIHQSNGYDFEQQRKQQEWKQHCKDVQAESQRRMDEQTERLRQQNATTNSISHSSSSSSSSYSSGSSSSSGEGGSAGIAILVALGITIWGVLTWLQWVTLGLAVAGTYKIAKKLNAKTWLALILAAGAGGGGYYLGDDWQKQLEMGPYQKPSTEVSPSTQNEETAFSLETSHRGTQVDVTSPCYIWSQANPALASKLQPGDNCYGF